MEAVNAQAGCQRVEALGASLLLLSAGQFWVTIGCEHKTTQIHLAIAAAVLAPAFLAFNQNWVGRRLRRVDACSRLTFSEGHQAAAQRSIHHIHTSFTYRLIICITVDIPVLILVWSEFA